MSNNFFIEYKLQKIGFVNDRIGDYFIVDILDMLVNQGKEVNTFSKYI